MFFAQKNNFSREDAWGHSGWRPRGFYYVGGDWGGERLDTHLKTNISPENQWLYGWKMYSLLK